MLDLSDLTIWTIGHSSRSIDHLIALLAANDVEQVADVRRYPGSRGNPQFNPEPFAASLAAAGIGLQPFPELGGRRRPHPSSNHTVWRNPSFQGYADYMDTADFRAGLDRLVAAARAQRTSVLCSEAVWWRCHRSMIADALKAHGALVLHIMDGKVIEHPYTAPARIVNGELAYPDAEAAAGTANPGNLAES